jgi:hypothetical protein
MANKVYYLDRDGATPQVVPANTDEKLKVYDRYEDIDTTDLVDGEIVSTKEDGAGGNVYDYVQQLILDRINKDNLLSEWEDITLPSTAATAITMDYDGFIYVDAYADGSQVGAWVNLYVNGKLFRNRVDVSTYNISAPSVTVPVKKGDVVYLQGQNMKTKRAAFYKQRYYGGRN